MQLQELAATLDQFLETSPCQFGGPGVGPGGPSAEPLELTADRLVQRLVRRHEFQAQQRSTQRDPC